MTSTDIELTDSDDGEIRLHIPKPEGNPNQRLDAHYVGTSDTGLRLQVTLFGIPSPAKERLTADEPDAWWKGINALELVCVHSARHNVDDDAEDTEDCFPPDPDYDDEEPKGFTRRVGIREEHDPPEEGET